ncbi:PAS domain S-box protein [Halobiforma nitratireducens]|uniref:Signal-transducing histidine kinase n=1 Tax=Halobiforma nitratireducens JCM 10879 TaxID=1227454 RepID=M0M6L1_9EURY|nr:PAS domain S-box protein [Halobiforma nitratireducens]EMA41018.1 signal-transducing histidine kinase [Halobiforma nitratireducens JCM 10879]
MSDVPESASSPPDSRGAGSTGREDTREEAAGAGPTETETVHLLVANEGDRDALEELLAERYRVLTDRDGPSPRADLYLVEDRVFPRYRSELRELTHESHPTFLPVVLVRQEGARRRSASLLEDAGPRTGDDGRPPIVDDVIDAPIDSPRLFRRLRSHLVRRSQSIELATRVSTLEERKRELRGFKRVVEQTGHSILIADTNGTIEYVNPSFERVTGYDADEAIGRTPRLLKSGAHDEAFYTDLWETITAGEVWKGAVINERKDGTRYVVDQTVAPITADGDIEGYISVNSDITDRIRRERQLERRERELEILRQILTRVLRHNIRNDLTLVAGYAERIAGDLTEPYASMGEAILETAERIERTSEKARTISSILEESGELTDHDLETVVQGAVATARERYPDATMAVDVPSDCRVTAGTHFRSAVDNLVENAVRHNDGPEPTVEIAATTTDEGTARLVVEDDGPGIPEHELAPLDSEAETPLEHASSTGLWLINWVVERADGSLAFDVTDEGTRVTVELPQAGSKTEIDDRPILHDEPTID